MLASINFALFFINFGGIFGPPKCSEITLLLQTCRKSQGVPHYIKNTIVSLFFQDFNLLLEGFWHQKSILVRCRFLYIFLEVFSVDFDAKMPPKMTPVCPCRVSKGSPGASKLHTFLQKGGLQAWHLIWHHFGSIFDHFWIPFGSIFDHFWLRVCIVF